ncbi:hypothetical protein BML2496_07530 [Providencia rettgeri]|nr:hypothetical protein CQA26_09200 [Providencia rettgeri]BBU94870.1 hypothetical protein BML2496_07530 [Providencia rettgeri]
MGAQSRFEQFVIYLLILANKFLAGMTNIAILPVYKKTGRYDRTRGFREFIDKWEAMRRQISDLTFC